MLGLSGQLRLAGLVRLCLQPALATGGGPLHLPLQIPRGFAVVIIQPLGKPCRCPLDAGNVSFGLHVVAREDVPQSADAWPAVGAGIVTNAAPCFVLPALGLTEDPHHLSPNPDGSNFARTAARHNLPPVHGLGTRPDVDFRGTVQHPRCLVVTARHGFCALRGKRPVVDPFRTIMPVQRAIGMLLPCLSPGAEIVAGIPLPCLDTVQPVPRRLAHGQHNVGMHVARIVTFLRNRVMQGNVCHHALTDKLFAHKVPHQRHTLLVTKLVRQRDVDFTSQLAVPPAFQALHLVPQPLTVGQPDGTAIRRHDFRMGDAPAIAVVMGGPGAFIPEPGTGPVGGGLDGIVTCLARRTVKIATAFSAPEHLHTEMINRHFGAPFPAGRQILVWRRGTYVASRCISALLNYLYPIEALPCCLDFTGAHS